MSSAERGEAAMPAGPEITALLGAMSGGDRSAFDRLFEAVYGELRAIARRQLRKTSAAETLSTTALVHELYLKFSRQDLQSQGVHP